MVRIPLEERILASADVSAKDKATLRDMFSFEKLPSYAAARQCMIDVRFTFDFPQACLDAGTFQILNSEFVDVLAKYLKKMHKEEQPDVPIVEICAGSGKLSHHLRLRGVSIIPTDSYEYRRWDRQRVEKLTHDEALRKYQPSIVLASWIPHRAELGIDVLKFPSVAHFVTVGEEQGGSCGHEGVYDVVEAQRIESISKYALSFLDCGLHYSPSKSFVEAFACSRVFVKKSESA